MMITHIEHMCVSTGRSPQEEAIHWTKSGDAFVVRDEKRLSAVWLRVFFGDTKFSSFTRKLYRWAFHKIRPEIYQYDRGEVTIFGSINFHRDKKHLLLQMESQTAAKQRRTMVTKQRKIKYQDLLQNRLDKTSDSAVTSYVFHNRPESSPLVNECSQEAGTNRSSALSSSTHQSMLGPRAEMLDRLQKGLYLDNVLREGGCPGSALNMQRFVAQDVSQTQSSLGTVLHVNPAFMQNRSSLTMHLLEKRIQQQKAQYESMHMQALAAIIRNRFAQE